MPKNKILLVEDDAQTASFYSVHLLSEGFQVSIAREGSEGIDKATEFLPDIIILDLNMPRMNGLEVLSALKKNKYTRDIPVIIVTANTNRETRAQALGMGAVSYYLKSDLSMEALIQAIFKELGQ
jgi:DNA-binding response OmpR family regulator